MDDLTKDMDMEIFKMPLGLIKLIEFPLSILAFSLCASYSTTFRYQAATNCTQQIHTISYPFELTSMKFSNNSCLTPNVMNTELPYGQGSSSSAQFFVFVGVMCMLWSLACIFVYVCHLQKYTNNKAYPKMDFVSTVVMAFAWLFAAVMWAFGAGRLKSLTNYAETKRRVNQLDFGCFTNDTILGEDGYSCENLHPKIDEWTYKNTDISAVLGFLMLMILCFNVWFVWKETDWFKNDQAFGYQVRHMGAPGPQFGPTGDAPGPDSSLPHRQPPQYGLS